MKTIPKQYDDPRIDRMNRYCERRLERIQQLKGRGYWFELPNSLVITVWLMIGHPLIRWGWLTTPQVYAPVIKHLHATKKIW